MPCPKCESSEIDVSGICLVCGYDTRLTKPPETSKETAGTPFEGLIEMDCPAPSASSAEAKSELPEWRQQLTKRLQEIKQKRDLAAQDSPPKHVVVTARESGAVIPAVPAPLEPPPGSPKPTRSSPGTRAESRPSRIQAGQSKAVVKGKPHSDLPLFDLPVSKPAGVEPHGPKPREALADIPGRIRDLIDKATVRQAASKNRGPAQAARKPEIYEDKLILLSRTLAGLIDMIVISICASACILAADFFSGIAVIDAISLIDYGLLFLLTYFLYSIYFLGTTNQTVGMMITELRVVGQNAGRPSIGQILMRCSTFLVSVLGAGIGLFWGCFDRESKCLHDRISGTRIVRIDGLLIGLRSPSEN